jgi:hypothetical protein
MREGDLAGEAAADSGVGNASLSATATDASPQLASPTEPSADKRSNLRGSVWKGIRYLQPQMTFFGLMLVLQQGTDQ